MRKVIKPENVFGTKTHSTHPSILRELQKEIFYNAQIVKQQKIVEILSAETRLQILFLLARRHSLCVGDMADTLRVDISAVSHQLHWLRAEKLVTHKKRGKVVYYSLGQNLPKLVTLLLEST